MLLLAGGSGSRIRDDVNKVYLPLANRPVLSYSLETLRRCPSVSEVVLIVREADRQQASELVDEFNSIKVRSIVAGGDTRHRSELAGLEAMAGPIEDNEYEVVGIHDGARPFASTRLIERVISTAAKVGGAVPGLPVEAPIYRVGEDSIHPLPDTSIRRAQTPQAFLARPLLSAYRRAKLDEYEGVDTADTVERYSDLEVALVEGDPRNLKLTFVEDFFRAEDLVPVWDGGRWRT
jgi:2-C-methyl-D-erythritol 4-phosphate cytidylyltransferase